MGKAFNFNSGKVANAYDSVLVPVLFEPWAERMIKDNLPWDGTSVLELACGTGVLTKKLIKNVGSKGRITALDINEAMIDLAKVNCSDEADAVTFIHGSAEELDIEENSIDKVVCQQGFQFFQNKKQAAREIYKVLKRNGEGIITTWRPVAECDLFQTTCATLEQLGFHDLSEIMHIPFDQKDSESLTSVFGGIGFTEVKTSIQKKKLFLNKIDAPRFVYSTPIGPGLKELRDDQKEEFATLLISNLTKLQDEDGSLGHMSSNVLTIKK